MDYRVDIKATLASKVVDNGPTGDFRRNRRGNDHNDDWWQVLQDKDFRACAPSATTKALEYWLLQKEVTWHG